MAMNAMQKKANVSTVSLVMIITAPFVRLPPEVNRILYVRNLPYKITAEEMYDIFGKYGAIRQIRLYVRNLPYKITAEEMYDIFGKYGAIRQIRLGNTQETKGTAFVVFEDIFDAKNACDHLSGFNVCNRY
ncbi:unnamed protein product, partial [Oppiella nova]